MFDHKNYNPALFTLNTKQYYNHDDAMLVNDKYYNKEQERLPLNEYIKPGHLQAEQK
jgi:hypothetical protein